MSQIQELDKEKLLRRKLDLLLKTGQMLVESAADTNRIIRNMNRVAAFLGLPEEHLHVYVQFNMLMVNLSDGEHSFTKFQRCTKHGINMTTISLISKLSWKAITEDYTIEQYAEELEKIRQRPRNYTPLQVAIGTGFACGGFCIQFGCDWIAFFYASLAAAMYVSARLVASQGIQQLYGHCRCGIRQHTYCIPYNVASVVVDRYSAASAVGLCALHRARCASHQLCR